MIEPSFITLKIRKKQGKNKEFCVENPGFLMKRAVFSEKDGVSENPGFWKKDGVFERTEFLKRTEFWKKDGVSDEKDGVLKTRVFGKRTEFFKMDGLLKRTEFFITYRRYKNVYFLKLPNIFILLQISGDRHEQ